MATIRSFEELKTWQKSRLMAKEIYLLTNSTLFSKDFALKNQMRRAAISIVSNIAEGFDRNGNKEFLQFLYISKASCAELRAQLYIALDIQYIDQKKFDTAHAMVIECSKLLGGLINYLKESKYKGFKFMEEGIQYSVARKL